MGTVPGGREPEREGTGAAEERCRKARRPFFVPIQRDEDWFVVRVKGTVPILRPRPREVGVCGRKWGQSPGGESRREKGQERQKKGAEKLAGHSSSRFNGTRIGSW